MGATLPTAAFILSTLSALSGCNRPDDANRRSGPHEAASAGPTLETLAAHEPGAAAMASTDQAPTKASLVSPAAGASITSSPLTLDWAGGVGVQKYFIGVGTSAAAVGASPWGDIYAAQVGSAVSSVVVGGVPITGQRVYVRLWSFIGSQWEYTDYSFATQPDDTTALSPFEPYDQASAVTQSRFLLYLKNGDAQLNWGGLNEKWLKSSLSIQPWYFLTPDGSLYLWDGSPRSTFPGTSKVVGHVAPGFYDDPTGLLSLPLPDDPASLQAAYKFVIGAGGLQTNWGGRNEKWLRASADGQSWHYILPDGRLYRWDGSPRATFPGASRLVGVLPKMIHLDPSLLLLADQGPVTGVTITGLTTAGEGCPEDSVSINISPDAKAFTSIYDSLTLTYDPLGGAVQTAIGCRVALDLAVPSGWQMTLVSVDLRGYLEVGELSSAEIVTDLSFGAAADPADVASFIASFQGPVAEDFQVRSEALATTTTWSECGTATTLNIDVVGRVYPTNDEPALINIDSIDGELTQRSAIVWRPCGN